MENSVPVQVNNSAPAGRNSGGKPNPTGRHGKPKKHKTKLLVAAAVLAVILLAVISSAWFSYQSSVGAHIDKNKYQAVFFTNGQVYFGKLERLNGGYFKLNDIYYLQAKADQGDDSKNPQQTSDAPASDVEMVKLGSEVHGPDDEMIMSEDQILFFENLKESGRVSDSISKYRDSQKN